MTIFMGVIIALLMMMLTVTLFNALTAPMLKRAPRLKQSQRVSVLVPARNEERNIASCLEGLIAQDYDDFEIIVLDDHSEDRTGEIIRRYSELGGRVKFVEGQPLPAGWTGKNWACHQLSQYASGEIFIFTDADNRHAHNAISHTVAWMGKLRLGLLSAFPQQITVTLAEKLVIPIVDMFVYAGLPLWLTYYARSPALAAANGQWIAFTSQCYRQIGGHRAAHGHIVEDVALSRLAKRKGLRILTTAGTRVVSGRMYHSAREVWEGFSKNIFGLVEYRTAPFCLLLFCLFVACVLPYVMVWIPPFSRLAIVAIGINILLRSILAVKYKHPLFISVVLHPIAILFTLAIGLNSFLRVKRGSVWWKGRRIDLRPATGAKE